MKFGVVVFPGSNCARDAPYVLHDIMGYETIPLWHKDRDLQGVDVVVIPGGFSYGDYLRSGALAKYSPIMESVTTFATKEEGFCRARYAPTGTCASCAKTYTYPPR